MATFIAQQPAFEDFRSIVRERTNPVVAWVGAGLSRPAGLPGWAELKDRLIIDLTMIANSLTEPAERKKLEGRIAQIRVERDYWRAFSNIKEALGKTEFAAGIRRALSRSAQSAIPSVYEKLWRINVSGMMTLNLDAFAKRSFAAINGGKNFVEFDGLDVQERVLKNSTPFIANLHGNLEDDRSWVFTTSDLRALFENPRYRTFISTILCARTVLFVGVTVDDSAVASHFEFLANIKFNAGDHFWLTERGDDKTRALSDKLGIRTILFDAPNGDYTAIDDFFSTIEKFLPEDTPAPPPVKSSAKARDTNKSLPPVAELCKLEDADEIRWQLNLAAADILAPGDEAAYEAYESFCAAYDQAIYRAWYVGPDAGSRQLLDYRILEEVKHSGAFGRVFRAENPQGGQVAIKVLHEGIRRDRERLQSFRRGARSMKILTDNRLEGMVRYQEACEIPAMVVMDWVDGPNLKQAVESRYIDDWRGLLKVGSELAETIRRAHKLPERVLHRDVRPPNVMLNNRYTDDTHWKVVVLDFDLSWHRDAIEKSCSAPGSLDTRL